MTVLLICLAGALGAGLRYGIDSLFHSRFPLTILLINVIGSFFLGVVTGLALHSTEAWHAVLATGFCGGFTTFSTVMAECVQMLLARRYRAATVNAFASIALTVTAAALGVALTA